VEVDPPSQSVEVEDTVKFTTKVRGVGEEKFSYQWRHNGIDIQGETSKILTLESVTESNHGSYTCVVRNEYKDVATSNIVKLLVQSEFCSL